ncbi:Crp/Fnr family transcriptional regulator [Streptomyces sp. NPDC058193]|uniref:Crp/Fnr family transcriptional regulator n=1 Tax=Streptomyces sp. NPDC058193 TaxID=3346373 RepID=UPI0036E03587
MTREEVAPERRCPTKPFTESEEELLRSVGRSRTWPAGAGLFFKGDAPDSLILVTEGRVKITADARSGYTSLLSLRGPGELVGEMACLDRRARSATAVTVMPVRGTVIASARFLALLEQDHGLTLSVLRSIVARLRHADALRADQGALSAGTRVTRVLLDLALRHGIAVGAEEHACVVPVSQADLAGAAGTSRESVVRALRELQRDGVVTTSRGRIVVHDLRGLGGRAGV